MVSVREKTTDRPIDKNTFGPWAVVTGASSGIGKEFARQLAASGLNLVLVARRLPLLEALGSQLAHEFGVHYRAVEVDLSEEGFLAPIEKATQDLDVGLLISNAGAIVPGAFLTIERSTLRSMVRLNVLAHLDLTHHFGQRLAQRGRGGVLLVSAMGAVLGLPYMANDSATKAYVLNLGEALHVEFQKVGVNVTVPLPSAVDTPVLPQLGLDAATMPVKPMSVEQCVDEALTALGTNQATTVSRTLATRMMEGMIDNQVVRA